MKKNVLLVLVLLFGVSAINATNAKMEVVPLSRIIDEAQQQAGKCEIKANLWFLAHLVGSAGMIFGVVEGSNTTVFCSGMVVNYSLYKFWHAFTEFKANQAAARTLSKLL